MSRSAADLILSRLREGSVVERVLQGPSWVLATVRDATGRGASGMAGIPHVLQGRCCLPLASLAGGGAAPPAAASDRPAPAVGIAVPRFVAGDGRDAVAWAELLRSAVPGEPATGLAVANALLGLDPEPAAPIDGVDWLLERAEGRDVAVVGRFPFVDRRLRPVARRVWVFERAPEGDELAESEAAAILPDADVVVITGGALVNGTLDGFVALVNPGAARLLLGPSTPLTSALFALGFHALSGVRVTDAGAVAAAVAGGLSFRRMTGLERVTLLAGR